MACAPPVFRELFLGLFSRNFPCFFRELFRRQKALGNVTVPQQPNASMLCNIFLKISQAVSPEMPSKRLRHVCDSDRRMIAL
jgi:hypothetical protein